MNRTAIYKTISISFIAVILFYGAFRIIPLLRGVDLKISLNNESKADNVFEIKGSALHAQSLIINGRQITMDIDGSFKDELVLLPGINKITISARDVRGKIHNKEMILTGKPVQMTVAQNNKIPDFPPPESITN